MNKFIWILALALCLNVQNAMAQSEAYSFDVDSKSRTNVQTSQTVENDSPNAGQEDTSQNQGDNAPAENTDDSEDAEIATEVEAESETQATSDVKAEEDPCAAYTSARGKLLCQDRIQKIERMKSAKDKRASIFTNEKAADAQETAPAQAAPDMGLAPEGANADNTQVK